MNESYFLKTISNDLANAIFISKKNPYIKQHFGMFQLRKVASKENTEFVSIVKQTSKI